MSDNFTDTILCVDDDANILYMFARTLGRKHKLITALSGERALKELQEHTEIAVIISDYNMPGMDGIELLTRALEVSPDTVQIMLTGNLDLDISIKAINETAIFRYLPKPCPTIVLQKVVADALAQYHLLINQRRIDRELKQTNLALAASNAELEKQKYLLEHELEMAKTVYSNVVSFDHNLLDGLDFINYPIKGVGGDFLLTYISKDKQSFYMMIGDLTGHGLQSALAVLLVAEGFELMCQTQSDIEVIATNINAKMRNKLPIGLFCAAILIKLDLANQTMHLWQGGMPDAYFLDEGGRIVKSVLSNNLPLGVCIEQDFTGTSTNHTLTEADSLFLYSDGVSEQIGTNEEQFGELRLQTALINTPPDSCRVDFVMTQLRLHQLQHAQSDDISLLELNFSRIRKALEQL